MSATVHYIGSSVTPMRSPRVIETPEDIGAFTKIECDGDLTRAATLTCGYCGCKNRAEMHEQYAWFQSHPCRYEYAAA